MTKSDIRNINGILVDTDKYRELVTLEGALEILNETGGLTQGLEQTEGNFNLLSIMDSKPHLATHMDNYAVVVEPVCLYDRYAIMNLAVKLGGWTEGYKMWDDAAVMQYGSYTVVHDEGGEVMELVDTAEAAMMLGIQEDQVGGLDLLCDGEGADLLFSRLSVIALMSES